MKKTLTVVTVLLVGAFLTEALVAADEVATSSTRPPTNLKKVGDHWTPWDPPAAGPDDYIIVRGDTLWDLAGRWLNDPFLWPQVWDQNRYILDSHWIYPGDPLVVPGRPEVVPPEGPPEGEDVTERGAGEAPAGPPTRETIKVPPLVAVADPADLYCSGFVEPDHVASEWRIAGRELEREHVGQGDVVYLNAGLNQGVRSGARLGVVRRTRSVSHPVTGQALGAYIRRLGELRVLAAQANTSIAVIEQSCEDLWDNDEVVSWTELRSPMMASVPKLDRYAVEPTGGIQGYVVTTRDNVSAVGGGHVIHGDLGAGTGITPGAILNIYRDNADLPRLMLGRAVVLTVEPGTCTAKVVQAFREIGRGDRIEVVAQ